MTDALIGPIPPTWQVTTLGEACRWGGGGLQTGPFGSQLHASDYVADGIPSIMPENIGDNRILTNQIARIRPDDAARLARYLVKRGDVVYSRRGDVTKRALVGYAEEGWLCGTGCLRVRLGSGYVDPRFASYYLGHPGVREWIKRHAIGATMPNLNTTILSSLPFLVPPLGEQRAIASVLGALDDKIELNRRMSETLEALARAIFQSWFVDFDPVRAKAEGRQPAGMHAKAAAQFPSSFDDSPLGPIPMGWQAVRLETQVEAVRGLSYSGAGLTDAVAGLPLHNLNSIYEGGGYKYGGLKWYDGAFQPRHSVQPGDLLVVNTEQGHDRLLIGFAAIVPRRFGDLGLFSADLFRVRPRGGLPLTAQYLYLLLATGRYHDEVTGYSNGTTINHLPPAALQRPWIALPPRELVARFESIVGPMFERQEQLVDENATLVELRDTLLPKLISGEIRIVEG